MTAIKLDRNVPVPRKQSKWPFATMKVGDSFTIPLAESPSMRAIASITGKRLERHFTVRREGDNYRCWRDK